MSWMVRAPAAPSSRCALGERHVRKWVLAASLSRPSRSARSCAFVDLRQDVDELLLHELEAADRFA